MRERITFMQPQEVELPGGSGRTDYVEAAIVWASVEPIKGAWVAQNAQIVRYEGINVKIRVAQFVPTKDMLLIHRGATYAINAAPQQDDRRRFWQIVASTRDQPVS